MARVTHVKKAQQRYETKPVIDPETGQQKVTPVLRKDGSPKMTRAKAGRPARPITMRVTEADKTRPKPNLTCEKCHKEILPGMPYKHITPKSGPFGGRQRNRCKECPTWRPSETTSSQHLSTLYAAQEAAGDALSQLGDDAEADDLRSILTDLAEGLREVSESYGESAQNIEDGFGHETSMSEELRERSEAFESAADEVDSAADDIEDFDEDDLDDFDEEEPDEDEVFAEIAEDWTAEMGDEDALKAAQQEAFDDRMAEYERAKEEHVTEKKAEWLEEQRSKVEDALNLADV